MCNSISIPYSNNGADITPTIIELLWLANKDHMVLAWEEAKELLELVKREKAPSLPTSALISLIDRINLDNCFGRMLTLDEEEELLANPNQVLIDD
jgi:hypothetical protein